MPDVNLNIDNVDQRIIINRTVVNMKVREISVCNTGSATGVIGLYTQDKGGGEKFYIIKDSDLLVSNTFIGNDITILPNQDFGVSGLNSSFTIIANYE